MDYLMESILIRRALLLDLPPSYLRRVLVFHASLPIPPPLTPPRKLTHLRRRGGAHPSPQQGVVAMYMCEVRGAIRQNQ